MFCHHLLTFHDFAGDVPTRPMLLGHSREDFACLFERDFHPSSGPGVKAFRNHLPYSDTTSTSPSFSAVSPVRKNYSPHVGRISENSRSFQRSGSLGTVRHRARLIERRECFGFQIKFGPTLF